MKILELCTSHGVGGLELYVLRSVEALRRMDCSVLAAVRPGTMLQQRLADKSLPYVEVARRSRILPLLAARRLARVIDIHEIDVVHMHWGHDLLLAALAKRWCARPVRLVYTRQMALTRAKNDLYHRFLYAQVDLYLTITDRLTKQARSFLPLAPEKIQRLYYGVSAPEPITDEQRAALRHALAIPEHSFAVGMVGRIEEQKGQHILIDAIELLHNDDLAMHASIIGPTMDDAYLDKLKARVNNRGLANTVDFHGPHTSPMSIMPAFDAVVLATRMETFGLVLAEAMRCGVAVVGTDAGGVPEIIEDGISGYLFPPEDSTALAAVLRSLSSDKQSRERVAVAGKVRADDLFAEEAHYQRLISHFDKLMSS